MAKSLLILEREHPADLETYRIHIAQMHPGLAIDIRYASTEADALAQCADCTAVAVKAQYLPRSVVAAMPRLDWIQALTSGTDALDALDLPEHVMVTSMRGIHGPQMSELAFLLMLALTRELPRILAAQRAALWERRPQALLAGKTVLIVGVGMISEAIATRCAAFDMRVIGASAGRSDAVLFDKIFPYSELGDAAAMADVVIVVTPYRADTHHLVSASVIGRMKTSALLINIARGNVVDETALEEALRHGRIAGAGLDVFATEPLPAENPFWHMDNVIVTPHIGGMSESYAQQAAPVLIANLRAYSAGLPGMTNIVRTGTADIPA